MTRAKMPFFQLSIEASFTWSYRSSHSFFSMTNPACSSPCSIVTQDLSFTSPEPEPPLIVFLAPLPYRPIRVPFFNGRTGFSPDFLFSRSTTPSLAIFSAVWRCLVSYSRTSWCFTPGSVFRSLNMNCILLMGN